MKKVEEEKNMGSDEEDGGSEGENEELFNESEEEDCAESDEVKKLKKDKMEKAEEIQTPSKMVTYPTCNTRSPPKALYAAMSGLSYNRKRCLKETGFKRLIKLLIVKLSSTLSFHVIENFHPLSMELRLRKVLASKY
ncbi:hypothetical protein Tco_0843254 [Tanacetum coccineum]|uniref:Uncharacterized protein n=1 Tax=Tanacetum coccineum TaxID=301880 RepID=A0ABQ5B3U4_9ASTR